VNLADAVPAGATAGTAGYLAAAIGATLITGLSKAGFGGGLGVIATPLMMMVLPANVAISMMLPLLIVCDILTLRHFPREWDRATFRGIAGGTCLGLVCGLGLLLLFASSRVDGERWIRLIVGSVSILFCLLRVLRLRWRRGAPAAQPVPAVAAGLPLGMAAGTVTMVAHAAGPIVDIYLLLRKVDRARFVGTAARYYLTFNTVKIPLYLLASVLAQRDYITFSTLRWDLWLLPFCPVGVAAGAWLNRRLTGKAFTTCIYVLLFVTGVRMLAKALFWR
jgi:uncharacterized membrane protein YfcA